MSAEEFDVKSGDTLSFDGKLPHGFRDIVTPVIEFVTVSTRPV